MGVWKRGTKAFLVLLLATLAIGVVAANVEASTFTLNNVFSRNTPSGASPWATAVFTDTGTNQVTLTLTGSLGASGQFITEWDFNVNSTFITSSLSGSMSSCTTCTSVPVSISSDAFKADGDGLHDIPLQFKPSDGSSTHFDGSDVAVIVFTCTGCSGFNANVFNSLSDSGVPADPAGPFHTAAHVQGIPGTGDQTCSGWISDTVAGSSGSSDGTCGSTPIPEPMTMFLGGTGLLALGYAGRKRLFSRFAS